MIAVEKCFAEKDFKQHKIKTKEILLHIIDHYDLESVNDR